MEGCQKFGVRKVRKRVMKNSEMLTGSDAKKETWKERVTSCTWYVFRISLDFFVTFVHIFLIYVEILDKLHKYNINYILK